MGSDFGIVQWLRHPLSGYGIHLFLKAFELGKLQGNYLLEMNESRVPIHVQTGMVFWLQATFLL